MENTQGKKPAEWFAQLKEPYRSEAIANIKHHDILSEILHDSLCRAFNWAESAKGLDYWSKIYNSIEAGETTYLETENVSLINEVNNTQVTEQQNQIESEKVEVDWKSKFEELQNRYEVLVTEAHKLDVLSGEMCDKYAELKDQVEKQNNQEKVYIHYNNKQEKWLQADTLELALQQSEDNKNIYEAVKIGVKKSILVNENS